MVCETAEHPFELVLSRLAQRGRHVRRSNDDVARARCPGHDDARPSLVVTRKPDRVLLHCFAGCRTPYIAELLGLRMADLYVHGRTPSRPQIIAEYDYFDANGVLIAQKVRMVPKG